MSFENLLPSITARTVLAEIQKRFGETRASLLRVRSERLRLARSGWRPKAPAETKLIRAAEWKVLRADSALPAGEAAVFELTNLDFESRFIPTESAFFSAAEKISSVSSARVRIRGLDIFEPRFALQGKAVCASFFDLVFILERNPGALIALPKVDGYLEARFWAEVLRAVETGFSLAPHSVRIEAGIDTIGGVIEAEEIIFELKDNLERLHYDPRAERVDALKLESASPVLPAEDPSANPWSAADAASHFETLLTICRRRGVEVEAFPPPASKLGTTLFTLDVLHAKVNFAFTFLRKWFEAERSTLSATDSDWVDFDLARALIWTAIHSGYLREENYEAWKAEFGLQPFEVGSSEEAALRTLDPLLCTAVFPESAFIPAFSALLELEKARSTGSLRHA